MWKAHFVAAALAGGVLLAALLWLGRLQAAGPPHADLVLPGAVPATLSMPPASSSADTGVSADSNWPPRVPLEARPPAVLLVHGFAGDRASLSIMARSLSQAGYATLAIDLRGHGTNRNRFERDRIRGYQTLGEEIATAVDYLRTSPDVDGERLVLVGHSMGAGAVLDYATRDPGLDGVVLISGGRWLDGPHRPTNALFLYASSDPARIRDRSTRLASRLAGQPSLPEGELVGSFRDQTAVRHVEVPGVDHSTIIASSLTVAEVVGWLDWTFDRQRTAPAVVADPRLGAAALALLALLFTLPGIGALAGRLAPRGPERPPGDRPAALGALAAALLIGLAPFAAVDMGGLLPLSAASVLSAHLGLAGLVLLVGFAVRDADSLRRLRTGLRPAFGVALGALVVVYALMAPLGVVFHNLVPTPERLAAMAGCTVLLLPFSAAFQLLLRRGPPLSATLAALAGRVVVLLVILAAAALGFAPRVVVLMLPALAILFVLVEITTSSLYAASRNIAVAAWLEALWLAWIFASISPIGLGT